MNFFRFIFGKKSRVKVVQSHDFSDYLKRIGAFDEVVDGNRFCASCGLKINLENVQAIMPGADGKFCFICDRPSCLRQVHD